LGYLLRWANDKIAAYGVIDYRMIDSITARTVSLVLLKTRVMRGFDRLVLSAGLLSALLIFA